MGISEELTPAERTFAFLGLLVASLPRGHYTADASRWATAISGLRNKYGGTYPHLFRYMHFRHAPRADSYSPEVSNFLAFLQFTDGVVVHNPGFTKMNFQRNVRKLLWDRYKELVGPEDISAIDKMSKEVVGAIKVNPKAQSV
jgi:hypothetical protein